MRLKKLALTNFMSIREAEVNFENQGLVLVQGENKDDPAFDSNGAGKSTIFEGLSNVLFDRTVRGLKSDEVIHEDIGKNCSQILDLEDADGVQYRIARYRKHKEHKNNVYVFRDSVNITPKSSKDTNIFIETLIGMDYDTFINSILFGQGQIKLFSVASDSEKKAILENMLNLSLIKLAQDKAKEKVRERVGEVDSTTRKLSQTETTISDTELLIESLKVKDVEEKAVIEGKIATLTERLREKTSEIAEEEAKDAGDPDKVSEIESEILTLREKLGKFKDVEKKRQEQQGVIVSVKLGSKNAESTIEKLKREVAKLKANEGTNCIACGQEITADSLEQSINHTVTLLRESMKEKQEYDSKIPVEEEKLVAFDKVLAMKDPINEEIASKQGELSELKGFISTRQRLLAGLKSQQRDYLTSIAELKKSSGETFKSLIEDNEKKRDELLLSKEQLTLQLEKQQADLKLYEFWVTGFGNAGIKSYLLDSVTPFLNKQANYYLQKLAGNTTEILFTTKTMLKTGESREKFDVQILNKVGGGAYSKNSTGERRRIDLAIALALQDLVMSRSNTKLNVLLYDEAFDGLDAVGCENVIQLLQEVQERVETVFVITHNDHLKPFFEKTITATKENGQTTVIQE